MALHASPTVLDLFCGAGGFSIGFERAGFDVLAGVDYDDDALDTYDENFDHDAVKCDLSSVDPDEFFGEYVNFSPDDIDVVVGGPPCQGYSVAGNRDVDDERNSLFDRYIDYVEYIDPPAFVAENVPGILSMEDRAVIDDIISRFGDIGYEADYEKLNAAAYGVPQTRERVVIIGLRGREPEWPRRTHVPEATGVVADD